MNAPDFTAPAWARWEKHKHRAVVALVLLASAIIASAPRNERRLFAFPHEPMGFMAVPAPEPTTLRSAIMGYLDDVCGSGGFVRIANVGDCGRRGRGKSTERPARPASSNVPSAFFAMPDTPAEIDSSPVVAFGGLSPIPVEFGNVAVPNGFRLPTGFGGTPSPILGNGRPDTGNPGNPTEPGGPPTGPNPSNPTGAVPEPASWAMMIVGLGLVGGLLRRGRSYRIVPQI